MTATVTKSTGYAGHRKGTIKEKAHRAFDQMNKGAKKANRGLVIKRIVGLGAAETTAAVWYRKFNRGPRRVKRPTVH